MDYLSETSLSGDCTHGFLQRQSQGETLLINNPANCNHYLGPGMKKTVKIFYDYYPDFTKRQNPLIDLHGGK